MSLVTVSYLQYTAAGVLSQTLADVTALSRAVASSRAGGLTPRAVRWHLDAATLPDGFEPRLGDQILDADAARWVVVGWQYCTLGTRWALDTERKV